jgi:hypothetical protein
MDANTNGGDPQFGGIYTIGVTGVTSNGFGIGVFGRGSALTGTGSAILGAEGAGIWVDSPFVGVQATTDGGYAVLGQAANGFGVFGQANSGYGVTGNSQQGNGVYAYNSPTAAATDTNATLRAFNASMTPQYVLYAENLFGNAYVRTDNLGDLYATGTITGAVKSVKIDHPLDPANKYLVHTSIESPDMKTFYDGVARLDGNGEVTVELPGYFEALNQDFRYQLTAIGAPGPNLYISEEISGNRFRIGGGKPGSKVSWMVTGIRRDAWANAHRSPVEIDKTEKERGKYLHPEAFGAPVEQSVSYNGGVQPRNLPGLHSKLPTLAGTREKH